MLIKGAPDVQGCICGSLIHGIIQAIKGVIFSFTDIIAFQSFMNNNNASNENSLDIDISPRAILL